MFISFKLIIISVEIINIDIEISKLPLILKEWCFSNFTRFLNFYGYCILKTPKKT